MLAAVLWRLSTGPISLAFLAPYVEEALSADDASYRVTFTDFRLTWAGWERTLDFRASDVQTYSVDGVLLATVPEIAFELSVAAILRGIIAPVQLSLLGPDIHLTRDTQGKLNLKFNGSGFENIHLKPAEAIEKVLNRDSLDRPIDYLQSITISGATLTVHNPDLSPVWIANNTDVVVRRVRDGIELALDLNLDTDDAPNRIQIDAAFNMVTDLIETELSFSSFNSTTLAELSPHLNFLRPIKIKVGGSARIVSSTNFRIQEVSFHLSGGPGELPVREILPENPELPFTSISVRGTIEPHNRKVFLDPIIIDFDGTKVNASGSIQGELSRPTVAADVTIGGLPAHRIHEFWPKGLANDARNWITARILNGTITNLDAHLDIGPEDWGNAISNRETIYAQFDIVDGSVDYLSGLPVAEKLVAAGWYDGIDLHLNITKGRIREQILQNVEIDLSGINKLSERGSINVKSYGPLEDILLILDASAPQEKNILPIDPRKTNGTIETDLEIKFPLKKNLTSDDLKISGTGHLNNVRIQSFILSSQFPPSEIEKLQGKIVLNENDFSLHGTTLVNAIPVTYSWDGSLVPEQTGIRRRLKLQTRLGDAERKLWEIDDKRVSGFIEIEAALIEHNNGLKEATLLIDGTDADVSVPWLIWNKPAGEPGNAKFDLFTTGEDMAKAAKFEIYSKNLRAKGSIELNESRTIETLIFDLLEFGTTKLSSQLRLKDHNQYEISILADNIDLTSLAPLDEIENGRKFFISGEAGKISLPNGAIFSGVEGHISRGKGKALTVEGIAQELDLRKYFSNNDSNNGSAHGEKTPLPALNIKGNIQRILIDDQITLSNFRGETSYDGEKFGATEAEVFLENSEKVQFRIDKREKNRVLSIYSANAGAALRALDITDDLIGGTLMVKANFHDNEEHRPLVGNLIINEFHIINAPILAKLLTIATLTGALELLGGQGLPFDQLHAPFIYRDGKITLNKARASSFSLGLTLDGDINRNDGTADLKGTIIPAYVLNSFVGHVPVIGDILTGGDGQGVFAATYHAQGPLDDVTISVNPLTALAPGILRDLFNLFEPVPKNSSGN